MVFVYTIYIRYGRVYSILYNIVYSIVYIVHYTVQFFSAVQSEVLDTIYRKQRKGYSLGNESVQQDTLTSDYSLLYSAVYSAAYSTVYSTVYWSVQYRHVEHP